MSVPYEAVILAAGRGSRLSEETDECPKALLPIGPRSLTDDTETNFLRRQLEILHDAGVRRAMVVVGYQGQRLRSELAEWAPWARVVENPTPEIKTSGSLHSFQFAVRSEHGFLDGTHQTLLMDGDICYHPQVLQTFLDAPAESSLLVSNEYQSDSEEVLVWGTVDRPLYLAKGLTSALTAESSCLGEAAGIVKFAPADHRLVHQTIDWMLGDPSAPKTSLAYRGFGPARRATEHEELTQRFMRYGKMRCVMFDANTWPFMEVDTAEEYALLRNQFYPNVLKMTQP